MNKRLINHVGLFDSVKLVGVSKIDTLFFSIDFLRLGPNIFLTLKFYFSVTLGDRIIGEPFSSLLFEEVELYDALFIYKLFKIPDGGEFLTTT